MYKQMSRMVITLCIRNIVFIIKKNKENDELVFCYWPVGVFLGSLVVTIGVYYATLHYAFQFDDVANIVQNFYLRHARLSELFWFGSRHSARWISIWLNSWYYMLDGIQPFWYRVGSVTLHIINGVALFFATSLFCSSFSKTSFEYCWRWHIASWAGALFLLHPVQTQTVMYVIQSELEGLALCATLLIIIFFFLREGASTLVVRRIMTGMVFLMTFISSGTKEIAIIAPVLLVIVDWFFISRGSVNQVWKKRWFYGLLFIFVFCMYFYLLKPAFFKKLLNFGHCAHNNVGNILTSDTSSSITSWMYCISQWKVILHYLWIFIYPFSLSVDYDFKIAAGFFCPDVIIPLFVLGALFVWIVQRLRHHAHDPYVFGLIWFFVALAPRSTFIPSAELVADYKTYMASCGLCIFCALWIMSIIRSVLIRITGLVRTNTIARTSICLQGLVVGGLALLSSQRNNVWSSGLALWGDAMSKAPRKARVYNNYGAALSQNYQRYEESIPYFLRAIDLDG
ncbi:MAG: hypothetical protein WBQ73_01525, partial [Candidatus Babeliales bacterium]